MIRVEGLRRPHGFMTRAGGVSTGVYAGLNCGPGSGDDPACVAENRARAVAAACPGAGLLSLHQVHSATVINVERPWADDARPQADAMVTAVPGLALGILTADCAPILLADDAAGVVGAAHSGWKGTMGDIAGTTVAAMVALGAARERMTAAIGPTIQRRSYEVDAAFEARFVEADPEHGAFFMAGRPGHAHFDLPGLIAWQLARAGVGRVITTGDDTYGDAARFFSYRRMTHRGEADYGRQLSVISL